MTMTVRKRTAKLRRRWTRMVMLYMVPSKPRNM